MAKVKLLNDGEYRNTAAVVGKTFEATRCAGCGWDIKITDLVAAGYVSDGAVFGSLYWSDCEVEVVDG